MSCHSQKFQCLTSGEGRHNLTTDSPTKKTIVHRLPEASAKLVLMSQTTATRVFTSFLAFPSTAFNSALFLCLTVKL